MTIVGLVLALVLVAAVCGYFVRNTNGARGTNQPGAMAGNLATAFVAALIIGVAVLLVVGATR